MLRMSRRPSRRVAPGPRGCSEGRRIAEGSLAWGAGTADSPVPSIRRDRPLRPRQREGSTPRCFPRTGAASTRWNRRFVARYNDERLHSALGYITPRDKLHGREQEIYAERDRKLAEARRQREQRRRERRDAARQARCYTGHAWAEDRATQRCDPSADSGPEAGVGGASSSAAGLFPLASGPKR